MEERNTIYIILSVACVRKTYPIFSSLRSEVEYSAKMTIISALLLFVEYAESIYMENMQVAEIIPTILNAFVAPNAKQYWVKAKSSF